ncbi:MAG: hypothetical protein IJN11_04230 [Oscillospiraceae bacterium]|nr:hypothetical protein [Oscillospiraceae bacterium]
MFRLPSVIKRILKKTAAAGAALALCLQCGCSAGISVDNLLTPPKLSSEQEQIYQALRDTTGSAISLKYPKSGTYLSAFIIADLDDDEGDEAIVFYEKTGMPAADSGLRINVLDCIDEEWLSVCDRSAEGTEIEKVMITRLGDHDRINVVVGCSSANQSDKYVSVYEYTDNYLDLNFSQSCVKFDVGSPDGKTNDLILLGSANAAGRAFAAVYQLDADGVYHEYKYRFDDAYTDYSQMIYGQLRDGRTVLYVDAVSGTSELRTEILCLEDRFVNLLAECGKTPADTLRRAGLVSRDIDHDGVPEIPVQTVFPGYEEAAESEQMRMTKWMMLEQDRMFTEHYSYYSINDGYLLVLPDAWVDKVTVMREPLTGELLVCEYNGRLDVDMPVLLRLYISYDEADTEEHLAAGYDLYHTKGTAAYLVKAEPSETLPVSAGDLLMAFRFVS